ERQIYPPLPRNGEDRSPAGDHPRRNPPPPAGIPLGPLQAKRTLQGPLKMNHLFSVPSVFYLRVLRVKALFCFSLSNSHFLFSFLQLQQTTKSTKASPALASSPASKTKIPNGTNPTSKPNPTPPSSSPIK